MHTIVTSFLHPQSFLLLQESALLLANVSVVSHTAVLVRALRVIRVAVSIITSAEEGGYVFGAVCSSVCPSDYSQTCERILTNFLEG